MPLKLHIDAQQGYDYRKEEFFYIEEQDVILEHCLLSVSRWEAKWKKPFLDGTKKGGAELLSYFSCMIMNDADENFVIALKEDQINQIAKYIEEEQTATTITHDKTPPRSNEGLTSELIYYYLAQVPAPWDICERWHFSRLLKLLEIASIKSQPEKKMSHSAWGAKQSALNAARRAARGTLG